MVSPSMTALAAFSLLVSTATAHSWPEFINKIDNTGGLTSDSGYPRSWMRRTDPGWSDNDFTNRIIQVNDSTMACSNKQRTQTQTQGLPRLKANAGDLVAIRYLENGHVTKPQVPPGKPDHSGTVLIFGSQDEVSPKLEDMLKWTADGKGGDGKGKLLVTQPFDDGMCYQVNPASPIYQERSQKYPNNKMELPCQADFKVPQEAKVGSPYSVFWYWNWTTVANNANMQDQELYTSCLDLDISNDPPANSNQKPSFNSALPIATQAVAAYFNTLAAANPAAAPPASAPASPAAPTPAPASPAPSPAGVPLQQASNGAVMIPSSAAAAVASAAPAPGPASPPVPASAAAPATPSVVALTASIPTSSLAATTAPQQQQQQPSTMVTVVSSSSTAASSSHSNPLAVNMDPNAPFVLIEQITVGSSVIMTTLPHATDKPASYTLVLAGNAPPMATTSSSSQGGATASSEVSPSQSQATSTPTTAAAPSTSNAATSSMVTQTISSSSSGVSTSAPVAPNTMPANSVAGGRAQFTSSQAAPSAAAPSMGAPANSTVLHSRGIGQLSRLFAKVAEEMGRH